MIDSRASNGLFVRAWRALFRQSTETAPQTATATSAASHVSEPADQISLDNITPKDSLGRANFAQFVLNTALRVDASHGATIGLESRWGNGKTWVLERLKSQAKELGSTGPILIEFKPWMLSGAADLVQALLQQIQAQLLQPTQSAIVKASDVAERIGAYARGLRLAKHLAPAADLVFPGSGAAIKLVVNIADETAEISDGLRTALPTKPDKKPALADLKTEVDRALAKMDRRLIVLIDDIDRLTPAEVATMMQAVKAVADFPNTVYLLAYDPDLISHALRCQLQIKEDHDYLEKIIQVALPLPEAPAAKMEAWIVERLRDALAEVPSPEEERDLKLVLPFVAQLIGTPRQAWRLSSRMAIAAPMLKDKLNMGDLLVAEAVSQLVPDFQRWVHDNEHLLLTNGREPGYPPDEHQGPISDLIRPDLKFPSGTSASFKKTFWALMAFLFHAVRELDDVSMWRSRYRRLQDARLWRRWRYFTAHQELIDVDELSRLVNSPVELRSRLSRGDGLLQICEALCEHWPDNLPRPAMGWCSAFAGLDLHAVKNRLTTDELITVRAIDAGLHKMPPEERAEELHKAIHSDLSLYVAGSLLKTFLGDQELLGGPSPKSMPFPAAAAERNLVESWLQRFQTQLENQGIDWPGTYLLGNWAVQFGMQADQLRAHATCILRESPELAPAYLEGLSDRRNPDGFGIGFEVGWDQLPELPMLLDVLENDANLQKSHSYFLRCIRQRQPISS